MLDVEGGEAIARYRAALAISHAHPQDAYSHFALSYALRNGGMYEEAAKECDLAFKLDPSNAMFRSCSLVFVLLGRYQRVPAYLDLDPLSFYVRFRHMELAILRRDSEEEGST
jgi:tetratricopeptide (TPR) repeat protein